MSLLVFSVQMPPSGGFCIQYVLVLFRGQPQSIKRETSVSFFLLISVAIYDKVIYTLVTKSIAGSLKMSIKVNKADSNYVSVDISISCHQMTIDMTYLELRNFLVVFDDIIELR